MKGIWLGIIGMFLVHSDIGVQGGHCLTWRHVIVAYSYPECKQFIN
jgi:hypothetical protein